MEGSTVFGKLNTVVPDDVGWANNQATSISLQIPDADSSVSRSSYNFGSIVFISLESGEVTQVGYLLVKLNAVDAVRMTIEVDRFGGTLHPIPFQLLLDSV